LRKGDGGLRALGVSIDETHEENKVKGKGRRHRETDKPVTKPKPPDACESAQAEEYDDAHQP
jgi:hypothetical protein